MRVRSWIRRAAATATTVALVASGASVALATAAGATAVPPATGTCTYTDTRTGQSSPALLAGVQGGDTITISCTGLTTDGTTVENGSVAVAESSPLAGVATPATAAGSNADQTHILLTSATSGAVSGSFVVCDNTATACGSAAATSAGPFKPADANPDAACPPTAAQVAVGLAACDIAVADVATQAGLNVVELVFASSLATPPSNPSLTLTPSAGVAGDVLTASGPASGAWWGAASTGASSATGTILAAIDGTVATASLTISPAVYTCGAGSTTSCSPGSLTAPAISGTITTPNTLTSGAHTIAVDEANETAFTGNGTLTPIIPGTQNVEASATYTVGTGPAVTASPGQAGNGVAVTVSGSNFDPQGGPVAIAFTTAQTAKTVDSTTATVKPDGTFSASLVVNTANEALGSNPITATQTAHSGAALSASTAFTVLSFSTGPCSTAGGTPASGCTVNQTIQVVVSGVANGLTVSQHTPTNGVCTAPAGAGNAFTANSSSTVTLTPITLNGQQQVAAGCLNTVQILDDRGTLVGWTDTVQLETDFTGGTAGAHAWDKEIPGYNLAINPSITLTYKTAPLGPSGVLSEVSSGGQTAGTDAGPSTANGYGQAGLALTTISPDSAITSTGSPFTTLEPTGAAPVPLCEAAPGGGGGTFDCDGALSLLVPPWVSNGTYQSTLDDVAY